MTKWEKEIMITYFRMILDKIDVTIDEEDDDIDWTEIGEVENE